MNQSERRTEEAIAERLTKLIRIGWVIAAGAFVVGGWVVKLEVSDRRIEEKLADQSVNIVKLEETSKALADKLATVNETLAKVEAGTYTLREAQQITERLIVLETQSRAQAEQIQEALDDLKVILQRQASL